MGHLALTAALGNDLLLAAKELRSSRFLAQFHRLDALILDELGFIPFRKKAGKPYSNSAPNSTNGSP
jgi:hypothetical protein